MAGFSATTGPPTLLLSFCLQDGCDVCEMRYFRRGILGCESKGRKGRGLFYLAMANCLPKSRSTSWTLVKFVVRFRICSCVSCCNMTPVSGSCGSLRLPRFASSSSTYYIRITWMPRTNLELDQLRILLAVTFKHVLYRCRGTKHGNINRLGNTFRRYPLMNH